MSFKTDSDWAKNKKSPDIIYSYVDREEIRYHKENGQIFEIVTTDRKTRRTRRVPASEMSIADFDAIKKFSDDNFHEEDILEVSENRGRVPLEEVENKTEASTTMEEKADPTINDAIRIVNATLLTDAQLSRLMESINGQTTREIADNEGVAQNAVAKSLVLAKRRLRETAKKFWA